VRIHDLDEAIEAVSKVYCPHTIEVIGPGRNLDAAFEVTHTASQPLVVLSYGTPVKIDAGNFPRLFLMMHCSQGNASANQANRRAQWHRGQTLPFSAGFETQLSFDESFAQKSMRVDQDKLQTLCMRLLGRPLEQPLRFMLRPFSTELERIWRRTLQYLWSDDEGSLPLTVAARNSLDEFLLMLLLHQHPHNYSAEIAETPSVPVPGLVRRAERYMIDNADAPITVSNVAAELGVSLRSLQAGFRQWRETTPNAFLRQTRLELARDQLRRPGGEANVAEVALRYGFSHFGRFSAYYRSAFGEAPSVTQRRSRSSTR
jgi:AraC-like DNA-binding protein